MTDYTELQKAAEYAAQDVAKFADEDEESRAFQQFHEEVSPETVLALIAENERLQQREQDLSASVKYWFNACGGKQFESGVKHADEAASKYIDEHWRQQRDQLKHSLDAIDKELRGNVNDPDPLTRSFHDAVSCSTTYGLVAGIRRERDKLKACLRTANEHAEHFERNWYLRGDEIDQLRAEVAGLKTGYEAYGRVNAELKAENEALRKYGEEFAVLAEGRREEADALRKDSESYRLLSFCHGQGTLQLVRSHHELCAEIRRLKTLAGEPVPPTPEEFIGPSPEGPTARIRRKLAAMGQGDRP